MSLARIELMAADRPLTVYPKKDRVEMGGGKFREFDRPDPRDLQEANDHWARLLAARKAGLPPDEKS